MSRASQVIASLNEDLSLEQKIKIIKSKGTILKLLKPVTRKGDKVKQIMVDGIEKSKDNYKNYTYKIIGKTNDSDWADSLEGLVNMIDWKDYADRKAFSK